MSERGTAPSSLTEVGERLEEIADSQAAVLQRLEHLMEAIRACTAEVIGQHQHRVDLVRRVATLEHEWALERLKKGAA